MHLCRSIQLFWQALSTREEGRTEDLEHAEAPSAEKAGSPKQGAIPAW
jgi:hypothetical protein